MPVRRMQIATVVIGAALVLSACGNNPLPRGLHVVAAENFWGSIAAQLAGTRASVTSIIVNPAQDPHAYEPTAADARALATARLVIVNGLGYDPWVMRLLKANPVAGRKLLTVASPNRGENPHRWYDPAEVTRVANAITNDLIALDPGSKSYYERRNAAFQTRSLAGYHRAIAAIRSRYAGTPVGASESIFAPMDPALRLDLITPPGLMKSIAEGTDVTAHDTLVAERQINAHEIRVWIYNAQNQAPAVQRLTALAHAHGIPTVAVTETLTPATASFQQWQVGQLNRLQQALHAATGR